MKIKIYKRKQKIKYYFKYRLIGKTFWITFLFWHFIIRFEKIICPNCSSTWVIKTYEGYWCKYCKNEF
jgi:hypothetical protein